MKKLSEMRIAKEAILSDLENAALKGGKFIDFGNGTTYNGPSNPSSIETYVDGMHWGQDGGVGSLFGDSWNIYAYGIMMDPRGEASLLEVKREGGGGGTQG